MLDDLITRLTKELANQEHYLKEEKEKTRELIRKLPYMVCFPESDMPSSKNPLEFDWPSPANIFVIQRGGELPAIKYEIKLSATDATGKRRLHRSNIKYLERAVQADLTEEQQKMIDALQVTTEAWPDILISPNGKIYDFVWNERILEEIGCLLSEFPAKNINVSVFRAIKEFMALGVWASWVDFWIGFPLSHEETKIDVKFNIFEGKGTKGFAKIRKHGLGSGSKNVVHLFSEASLSGHEVCAGLEEIVNKFRLADLKDVDGLLDDVEYKFDQSIVTNSNTLQPLFVTIERSMHIKSEFRTETTRIEYRFHWDGNITE